ncbi:TPA: hypothetical protein ACIJSY_006614, partial [Pseudomonas aeruginosa]
MTRPDEIPGKSAISYRWRSSRLHPLWSVSPALDIDSVVLRVDFGEVVIYSAGWSEVNSLS